MSPMLVLLSDGPEEIGCDMLFLERFCLPTDRPSLEYAWACASL